MYNAEKTMKEITTKTWEEVLADENFLKKVEIIYNKKEGIKINYVGTDCLAFEISSFKRNDKDVDLIINKLFIEYNYNTDKYEKRTVEYLKIHYKEEKLHITGSLFSFITYMDSLGIQEFIKNY